MENKKFEDKYEIQDHCGPRGFVTLYEGDKVIFARKENKILNAGREYIYKLAKKYIFGNTDTLNTIESFSMKIGTKDSAVLSTDTVISTVPDKVPDITGITPTCANNDYSISLAGSFSVASGQTVSDPFSEIGINLISGENNILFSRIVFDPVYLKTGTTYNIIYVIYF